MAIDAVNLSVGEQEKNWRLGLMAGVSGVAVRLGTWNLSDSCFGGFDP